MGVSTTMGKRCYCGDCRQESEPKEVKQLTRSGLQGRFACGLCGSFNVRWWEIADPAPATPESASEGKREEEEIPDRPELLEVREILERLCKGAAEFAGWKDETEEAIDSALEELSAYLK